MLAINMADGKTLISLGEKRNFYTKYEGSHRKLILVCLCALVGAFNFGIAIGYSSPAIPSMIKRGVLEPDEAGWFASLLTIGAILGGPFAGFLVEKVGRKLTLTALSVPFTAGFLIIASATESSHCYVGRFLTGIGSGMVTVGVPVYVAEISTASVRGIAGSCVQLFVTIGIAAAYTLGVHFEWRWLANLCIVPSLLGGLLTFFIPETPRWLLRNNRKADALFALKALRDSHTDLNDECREIEEGTTSVVNASFYEVMKNKAYLHPTLLIVGVLVFQQLSGINAVMFFSMSILENAVGDFAYVATIIIGIVQVFATLVAVFLIDRAGRTKLLNIGGLVTALTLLSFGFYYRLSASGWFGPFLKTWIPVMCLTIYIIGFSVGWGPMPMLLMSELVPSPCKGIAGSVATVASWSTAFLITNQFASLQAVLGHAGVFYVFSAFCALSVWFVSRYIPETKGKSLEAIEAYFSGKPTVLV